MQLRRVPLRGLQPFPLLIMASCIWGISERVGQYVDYVTSAAAAVFSVDHAMTCHKGGYLNIRHNKI